MDGLNIGDLDVLMGVVEQVGLPAAEARDVLEQRLMQTAVDDDWRYARSCWRDKRADLCRGDERRYRRPAL